MTYQKQSQIYDDAYPLSLSPSSLVRVRQEEAGVAKKKKLWTALAVGVAAGPLLLGVAGDYYSVVVVATPGATATGGATEKIVDLLVGVDKPFGTCSAPDGTFNGWSCDNKHGPYPYRDGCVGNIGQFKTKDKDR